jgi:hypothetical protein
VPTVLIFGRGRSVNWVVPSGLTLLVLPATALAVSDPASGLKQPETTPLVEPATSTEIEPPAEPRHTVLLPSRFEEPRSVPPPITWEETRTATPSHAAPSDDAPEDASRREYEGWKSGCARREKVACFMLRKTTITGFLAEFEDARTRFRPGIYERTGLTAGWGFGFRLGIDLWDWVPLHAGLRLISPNDSRTFSQSVYTCTQQVGEPEECADTPHPENSSTDGVLLTLETGVQPSIQLAPWLALSPGVLVGYAWLPSLNRSIDQCTDCTVESMAISGNAPYVAPSMRLTWLCFGLSFRYDRYLGGDFQDAMAIGFDLNFISRVAPHPD